MGTRTSIYLSDDLHAAVKASGVPVAELVRRGLAVPEPLDRHARLIAAEAAAQALEDRERSLSEIVERAVRSALRDMQGGHL